MASGNPDEQFTKPTKKEGAGSLLGHRDSWGVGFSRICVVAAARLGVHNGKAQ
jgi:hypothetical protein